MLRTLLALLHPGTGRRRKSQEPRTAPLSYRLDPATRGARIARQRVAEPPSRYALEAEEVALVRPYVLAHEARVRLGGAA